MEDGASQKEKYPKLTKIVCGKLKETFKDKGGVNEYRLFKENGLISFKADFSVELSSNTFLFVEVEETQTHPDTNVSKYWMFLEKNKGINIILIQIFGRGFTETKNNYRSRLDLCNFIAGKMSEALKERFKYYSKELNKKQEEYKNNSELIGDEIISFVNQSISP